MRYEFSSVVSQSPLWERYELNGLWFVQTLKAQFEPSGRFRRTFRSFTTIRQARQLVNALECERVSPSNASICPEC